VASGFDLRKIKVTIDLGTDILVFEEPLAITVAGTNYANSLQNEAEIIIENLSASVQNYILTGVTPFNKNYLPKSVRVEAGREKYGTSVVYEGNVVEGTCSDPPDIGVSLKCLTGNYALGNLVNRSMGGTVSLKVIAQQIANDNAVVLKFDAENRNLPGYSFSGPALDQVYAMNNFGGIDAFIDDGVLYVKDGLVQTRGQVITQINKDTGMIGIPQLTEEGVKIKFLFDPKVKLGAGIVLTTVQYPELNGEYVIYRLGFQLTTRENPFYYIADCKRASYK